MEESSRDIMLLLSRDLYVGTEEHHKRTSVSKASAPAEIRTRHLPNTGHDA
jgi:hypothetical protein